LKYFRISLTSSTLHFFLVVFDTFLFLRGFSTSTSVPEDISFSLQYEIQDKLFCVLMLLGFYHCFKHLKGSMEQIILTKKMLSMVSCSGHVKFCMQSYAMFILFRHPFRQSNKPARMLKLLNYCYCFFVRCYILSCFTFTLATIKVIVSPESWVKLSLSLSKRFRPSPI
jgi:hypothetical protein